MLYIPTRIWIENDNVKMEYYEGNNTVPILKQFPIALGSSSDPIKQKMMSVYKMLYDIVMTLGDAQVKNFPGDPNGKKLCENFIASKTPPPMPQSQAKKLQRITSIQFVLIFIVFVIGMALLSKPRRSLRDFRSQSPVGHGNLYATKKMNPWID
jgi:hypothetical protein